MVGIVESEKHMSNEWTTAEAGRRKTISAAKSALNRLHLEGKRGYCERSEALRELVRLAGLPAKLGSKHPANYWLFYAEQPESFDLSAKIETLADQCREIASRPLGVL